MRFPTGPAGPGLEATRRPGDRSGRRPALPLRSRRRACGGRAPFLLAAAMVVVVPVALALAGCGDGGPVSRPAAPVSDGAGERLAEFGPERLTGTAASRFAALALHCVVREYPNKVALRLASDEDLAPPRELTPVFYGCFDWHSAVHGHWLLARLTRRFPEAGFAAEAREALDRNLTPERVAGEIAYVSVEGRRGFERPYGLAWLLQLDAELFEWARDTAAPAADRDRCTRPLKMGRKAITVGQRRFEPRNGARYRAIPCRATTYGGPPVAGRAPGMSRGDSTRKRSNWDMQPLKTGHFEDRSKALEPLARRGLEASTGRVRPGPPGRGPRI